MRRALRGLSAVLIVVGLLLVVDAGLTLVWQEPVSGLYAGVRQHQLAGQFEKLETAPAPPTERKVLASLATGEQKLGFAARSLRRRAGNGSAVARIKAPSIGLSTVVVQGTDTGDLRKAPGHYPDTPLPGAPGTVAIAGHRTTYGAPFRKLNDLKPGARIEVVMPYGRFTYAVTRTRIVLPTATWVTRRVGYDQLVLTACHPLYSAAKRIVVFAKLTSSVPKGEAA
jgi:sortase A